MQSEFSALLRAARKEKNLTQKQLAELLGVSTGTVQQWELGTRFPRVETLKRIEEELDIALIPQKIEDEKREQVLTMLKNDYARLSADPNSAVESIIMAEEIFDSWFEHLKDPSYVDVTNPIYFDILTSFNKLNDEGMIEASKRVEEMTRLAEYQRIFPQEPIPEDQQGKPSTTQEKPPEGQPGPEDGK